MAKPNWIMSPQAHRRLVRVMTEGELRDLAIEIARDLKSAPRGVESSPVIFATLTRDY